MKRLAPLLLCLGASIAQASHHETHPFTGFYLSGALGATSTRFDLHPSYSVTESDFFFPSSHRITASNPYGLLGVEYLYQINHRFVIGAQATAGYTKTQSSYQDSFYELITPVPGEMILIDLNTNIESELTNDFALVLKPGIVCGKNTLFYGLIGPRWGNFKTQFSASYDTQVTPDHDMGFVSGENSGYELGLTAGVGIQQILSDHFHLNLEYAYTDYGEIESSSRTTNILHNGVPATAVLTQTTEINASTNTLMFVASYQW